MEQYVIPVIGWIIGGVGFIIITMMAIIGNYLNRTMNELKEVKTMSIENARKIDRLENDHLHLSEKFEKLYEAVKDLTVEIKQLTIQLAKKNSI